MEEDVFILFWQFLIFDFGDTLNRREVLKKQRKRERDVSQREQQHDDDVRALMTSDVFEQEIMLFAFSFCFSVPM